MLINAIKCLECNTTVFSRAQHDYRSCTCGACAIDGGREYQRVMFDGQIPPQVFMLEVDATEQELFDDWNYRTDKFGIIGDKNVQDSRSNE
jgi:hypothetical protein